MVDDDIKAQARRLQTVTVVSSDKQYNIKYQLLKKTKTLFYNDMVEIQKVFEFKWATRPVCLKWSQVKTHRQSQSSSQSHDK